jgi:hypothetical protein
MRLRFSEVRRVQVWAESSEDSDDSLMYSDEHLGCASPHTSLACLTCPPDLPPLSPGPS